MQNYLDENTDDTDQTDFHGYDIRAYPRHQRHPRSFTAPHIYHSLNINPLAPIHPHATASHQD